ncbi:hypothetical protein Tco_0536011 [Tanacetum coccineum]
MKKLYCLDSQMIPEGDDEKKVTKEPCKEGDDSSKDSECSDQENEDDVNSTNNVNVASTNEVNAVGENTSIELPDDPNMHELEDIVYSDDNEDVSAEADMNNKDAIMPVVPIHYKSTTQMDVKSDFLYGKIEEEVYVLLTTRFEDSRLPNKENKVEKALYDSQPAQRIVKPCTASKAEGGWDSISQRQKIRLSVAHFITEAEYVAASSCFNTSGHNLLLLLEINAAKHNLLLLLEVNAARHNLLLLLEVNAARYKLTTAVGS